MRNCFAIISPIGTLSTLLIVSRISAAPVPKPNQPAVYALLYLGQGKANREDERGVALAARAIRLDAPGEWRGKFRVSRLKNTRVLRLTVDGGTRTEQADAINTAMTAYMKWIEKSRNGLEAQLADNRKNLEKLRVSSRVSREKIAGQKDQNYQESIRNVEREIEALEALRDNLPRPLEWADTKPKSPYVLLFVPRKTNPDETTRTRRRQQSLLESRSTLSAALRNCKADDLVSLKELKAPVAWLQKKLKFEYLDRSGVLRLSLLAGSRREQALLVNAIVQTYFQREVRESQRQGEQSIQKLKKRLESCQQFRDILWGEEEIMLELEIIDITARIRQCEADLRTSPQLLELADVPPH